MQNYRKVSPLLWIRGSGKKLRGDHEALAVALYLCTAPGSTMTGLYHLTLASLLTHLGMSEATARAALGRVSAVGFAFYDEESELAWVPNLFRFEVGKELKPKDKRRSGAIRQIETFEDHRFAIDFWRTYAAWFPEHEVSEETEELQQEAPSKALPNDEKPLPESRSEAPSKGHPSGEVEQRREQEWEQRREREQGSRASAREPAPPPPSEHPTIESVEGDKRVAVSAIRQEYRDLYRLHTKRRGKERDPHMAPQESYLHSAAAYIARLHHEEPDEATRHAAIDADCRRAVRNFMKTKRKAKSPQLQWLNEKLELYLDGTPTTKREDTQQREDREIDAKHEAMAREQVDPEEAKRLAAEAIGAVVGRSQGMFPAKTHPEEVRAQRNDESQRQREALRKAGS